MVTDLWRVFGENWHAPTSFCALAFHSEWKDRNADCCVNTADDHATSDTDKNFGNFDSVTPEIAWMIGCTRGQNTHVFVVSARVYRLIFTKHSACIERLVGFITGYSNCDGSLKAHCYGNRFVARAGVKLTHPVFILCTGIPQRLGISETDDRLSPLRPVKMSWTLGPLRYHGAFYGGVGECKA